MATTKLHLSKSAPPPPPLPIYQQMDPREVSFIGRTNYEAPLESKKYVFGITRADRNRHLYVIGKFGVGKSKLLELLIRQDIAYGYGMCLLDPHGDLIAELLKFIPRERTGDIIVFDPTDMGAIAFNPFRDVAPELRHRVAGSLVEAMERQFGAHWTPRLEQLFRFAVLALLDYPEATLHGLVLLLTDGEYRAAVVPHIGDEMVRRFFEIEFTAWTEKFESEATMPLVNRIGRFLAVPAVRAMFGNPESRVDFGALMHERKILLVNLAKGKLGEDNAAFLGALCVTKFLEAGMVRAGSPPQDVRSFYLYCDEFASLVTPAFMQLYAEARKYKINITLAHQYTAELPPPVLAAVLGSVGNIITFRVGGEDAERLEAEFAPVFKAKDMLNLTIQEFYIKETIAGEAYDPFSAETLKVLPPSHPSFRDDILAASRRKYGIRAE